MTAREYYTKYKEDNEINFVDMEDLFPLMEQYAKQIVIDNSCDRKKIKPLLIDFMDWYNEDKSLNQITEDELELFIKEKIKHSFTGT